MAIGWFAYKASQVPNIYVNDEIYATADRRWEAVNIDDPLAFVSEKLDDSSEIWRKICVVLNKADLDNWYEATRVFQYHVDATVTSATEMLGGITMFRVAQASGNYYAIRYARQNNAMWSSPNNLTPFTQKYEKGLAGNMNGGFSLSIPLTAISMYDANRDLVLNSSTPIRWVIIEWRKNSGLPHTYNVNVILTTRYDSITWYLSQGGSPTLDGTLNYAGEQPDPYGPGGYTEPTLPTGDFNNTSDPIGPAPLPILSAVDTRFISLFAPDITQLNALASYMWGAAFDLDTFKKLFTDPMAAILGLSIVPVTPSVSPPSLVTLGNIQTSVSMPKITSQYVTVPCGTLNVSEYWGAYLDYSPYTKLEIYLPYIGIQTLNADDIMGRSITVTYNIDILSGACVAMLTCGDSVLYTFAGSCATSVPITGRDWTNVINGVISVATGAAGVALAGATGGASVAAGAAGTLLGSTINNISSIKPTVQKSGTMASAAGMLGIQRPYLILTRPRQALPQDQNTYTGYPSYITQSLGSVSGYTIVEEVHLDGVPCTADEHDEIMSMLKDGVIF